MSAYLVAPEHIGLIAAFYKHSTHDTNSVEIIAGILAKTNIASVACRYPDDKDGERPGPAGMTDEQFIDESQAWAARYFKKFPELSREHMADYLACYDYQCAECEDWEGTDAYKIISEAMECLPDEAKECKSTEWGWNEWRSLKEGEEEEVEIKIKNRFKGLVLFDHTAVDNTIKATLEVAVKAGIRLDGADLVDCDLTGAHFDGAKLPLVHLNTSSFSGSSLVGANFEEASLRGTCFDGARLRGAQLVKAYCSGADFFGADMSHCNAKGADFTGAWLKSVDFNNACLAGASFVGASLIDAKLESADCANADFRGASLLCASFVGANLTGATFDGAKIQYTDFHDALIAEDTHLVGPRPVVQFDPFPVQSGCVAGFITDKGLRLRYGSFFGTKDEFVSKVFKAPISDAYKHAYLTALAAIEAYVAATVYS